MLQNYPFLVTVTAPGHLSDLMTVTAYEIVPSPYVYYWLSPQVFTVHAVSSPGIGLS